MEHEATEARRARVTATVLMLGVIAGLAALSWIQPLSADDIANSLNLQRHPSLVGFVGHYYEAWTGRATGMALLWLALQSRAVFAVANALAFGSLAVLSFGVAAGRLPRREWRDVALVAFTLISYWFALPAIAETVSWVTGSVTYLWPAVLMLAVIYPCRRWIAEPRAARAGAVRTVAAAVGMLAAGVLAGLSHELVFGVLGVLGLALAATAFRHKRLAEVPLWVWTGVLGLIVGGAMLVLSPGNAARSNVATADVSLVGQAAQYVMYLLKVFGSYLPKLYPWLLCLALLALPFDGHSVDRTVRRDRWWLVWAGAAALTLAPFVAEPQIALQAGQRTTVFAAVLLTVSALSLVLRRERGLAVHALGPEVAMKALAALLVLVLVELGGSVQVARNLAGDLVAREAIVSASLARGERAVRVPPLPTHPYRTVYWVDLEPDPDYWLNQSLAEWYGVDSIVLDPSAER